MQWVGVEKIRATGNVFNNAYIWGDAALYYSANLFIIIIIQSEIL